MTAPINTTRLEQDFNDLIAKLDQTIPGDISTELKPEEKKEIHAPENKKTPAVTKESLNFFERFLHDSWGIRSFFALGNEIAESSKHLLANHLPKPLADAIYKVLWSLAIIATGSRVGANTIKAKDREKLKAGTKMLVHDGIAAIGVPTLVANVMNSIQHKIYGALKFPTFIRDLFTTVGSLWACNKTIHFLDPHAAELGAWSTQLRNDRHKEINDALGRGH